MIVTYNEIIGHKRPIEILEAAIRNDRVAHAYIFSGPDGVGKKTLAIAFAAALNCEKQETKPCGVCNSCHKIAEGIHPDVSIVERDGKFIKIDQVREIGRQVNFAPYEGRTRIYIIDDAEKMNVNAANSLLKTLEEPKPRTVLILTTSNPQQLLPTILSRCQRINFSALSNDELETIALDRVESDPGAARLLAVLAKGSVGKLLAADPEAIIDRRRELLTQLATLDPFSEVDISDFAEKILDNNADLSETCELLKAFLRDAAVYGGTMQAERLINRDMAESIAEFAKKYDPSRLLAMGRSVEYAQRLLVRNVNRNLVAMSLALELVHPTGGGFDAERMPR